MDQQAVLIWHGHVIVPSEQIITTIGNSNDSSVSISIGVFILKEIYYLSTVLFCLLCFKFFRHKSKTLHHCRVCNYWLTNSILFGIYRYVCNLSPYKNSHVWLQWFFTYCNRTEAEVQMSYSCHVVVLHSRKQLP
jgi:hypothetical protein